MKGSARVVGQEDPVTENTLLKSTFLSYYISMYNSVNKEVGFDEKSVSVDEIYEFLQDLKFEGGETVPDICKEDIAFCFHVLHLLGVCKMN